MENKKESLSESELQLAIKSILLKRNEFNKIRAEIRSKVIEILRENDEDSLHTAIPINDQNSNKKPQSILNKLILQYFSWFGYKYAAEVFSVESGINQTEIDCFDIISQFNLDKGGDDEKISMRTDLPILLSLIIKKMIDE